MNYYKAPKSYSMTAHDISRIPLVNLARDYSEIREAQIATLAKQKRDYLVKLKEQILETYKAREESYEGSFEEYNLEERVAAKFSSVTTGLETKVTELVEEFCKSFSLKSHASWFFPQMLAKFAQLTPVKNSEGFYDPKQLLVEQIKPDPTLTALWLLCKHPTRSSLLDKQTSQANRNYSSLVPLILSAFKKYNNIPYSSWDRGSVHGIVENQLAKCMVYPALENIPVDELIELRTFSLTPKSGKDAGIPKNPATTYTLYPPPGSPISSYPMLLRIMVCQTWCAHPSNRTEYMILDPNNWDNMPEPLISDSVIASVDDLKTEDWML